MGVGQEPEPILILRPIKLNFLGNEDIEISQFKVLQMDKYH